MWELYDSILEQIPDDGKVIRTTITPIWTVSLTSYGPGIAMTPPSEYQRMSITGKISGMSFGEMKPYLKSWNFHEAAVALSAVNSWYNREEVIASKPRVILQESSRKSGIFGGFDELIRGKKVTMIGHGPIQKLQEISDFTCLERLPHGKDLPDPACEYILPEQDFVFITATALENKTMSRLLKLCENACTVIWGPSTALCERYFDYGADVLCGQIIRSYEDVLRICGEGGFSMDMFSHMESAMMFRDNSLYEYINNIQKGNSNEIK